MCTYCVRESFTLWLVSNLTEWDIVKQGNLLNVESSQGIHSSQTGHLLAVQGYSLLNAVSVLYLMVQNESSKGYVKFV